MYPHLPGVLPPNLQQQLLFQQMQQTYGQMQQQAQVYGGAPPQQINLQLQQPTMQMQPLPVQQSYTRKPRGRNAIRIINPDTGDETKVDSGASEPPQVPTPPVIATPALMTSSVGVSSTESSLSSTRGGAPEEFRRKVAQAANSEPRPPPPPNAVIRDPRQIVGTMWEMGLSELPPLQPMSEVSSKLLPLQSKFTAFIPRLQKQQAVADSHEFMICRKTDMIVDHLAQNSDFKVRVIEYSTIDRCNPFRANSRYIHHKTFSFVISHPAISLGLWYCKSRKGGARGGGWVHPKGANSMAVSELCRKRPLLGLEGPFPSFLA